MEKLQKQLTSPGSVGSSRGSSVPGSPSSIVARMDNEVLAYKDLAALPKDKAILDIERPDLMIYEPHFTYSLLDHVERPRSRERSLSPKSLSPPPSPEVTRDWMESKSPGSASQAACRRGGSLSRSGVHHFHRPDSNAAEMNLYKKPPIYKQREHPTTTAPQSKHVIEDLIIESSKFPAAQPPDPNQPAKIETDYWPCPPSLAVVDAANGPPGHLNDTTVTVILTGSMVGSGFPTTANQNGERCPAASSQLGPKAKEGLGKTAGLIWLAGHQSNALLLGERNSQRA